MSIAGSDGRLVVNVDGLWGADPRWYRLGDVSLGDRGVPQLVIFYAAAGITLGWLLSALPAGVTFWPTGAILALGVTGLGLVRPGGLRAHQFLPVAATYLLTPRHRHGWMACQAPLRRWRPAELPIESDGSRPAFESLTYTGPGLLIRHRPARHLQLPRTTWERLRGREARQALEPAGDEVLPEGREVLVAAGVTVLVRERAS